MSERALRRDDDRDARASRPPEPAAREQTGLLGLASGMGNAAFAKVARQWNEDTIVMPEEHITATPSGEGDTIVFEEDEIRL